MPSLGQQSIAANIGDVPYSVEGGFETEIKQASMVVQKLATGMDTGWTSASPSTVTTMATTIPAAFNSFVIDGLEFLTAIGTGIDAETALWAASWNSTSATHLYIPSSASIMAKIQAASPTVWSAGAQALAQAATNAFLASFEQEVG